MKENGQSQLHIGRLIKSVREARGITQAQFARQLKTSQSAVARMEQGGQNFSTALLDKIGEILGRKLLSVPAGLDFIVHGGRALYGEVTVNTSKNGAMGLLCASVLNRGTTILHGIPRVEEVERMKEV